MNCHLLINGYFTQPESADPCMAFTMRHSGVRSEIISIDRFRVTILLILVYRKFVCVHFCAFLHSEVGVGLA